MFALGYELCLPNSAVMGLFREFQQSYCEDRKQRCKLQQQLQKVGKSIPRSERVKFAHANESIGSSSYRQWKNGRVQKQSPCL